MRKILLSMVCFAAMTASAQVAKVKIDNTMRLSKAATTAPALMEKDAVVNGPHRLAADGVYYKIPAGSMWRSAERPLYSYGAPFLTVAPWRELQFTNMGTTKKGTWSVITASTTIDEGKYADEANNLLYPGYSGGAGAYYGITYTEGDVAYIPTTDDGKTCNNIIDGVDYHTFFSNNVGDVKYYGGGSLDNKNLYGAGTLTLSETEKGVALGIIYTTPKPLSPLYVEKLTLWGNTHAVTGTDVMNGKTLTAYIYNREVDSDEPVYTLTCTPEECVLDRPGTGTSGDFFQVNFTMKVMDEVSGELVASPFVIDFPAEIDFLGFDQEGVELGIMGTDVQDEFLSDDQDENQGYFPVKFEDGTIHSYLYSNTVPYVTFYSMFEICDVMVDDVDEAGNVTGKMNGIKVSDDGTTCTNNVYGLNKGAIVMTALDWTDEETGEEMYWSDDVYEYEWLQGLTCTYNKEAGWNEIGVTADALPEGVDKRYAVIHLNGRGVTSDPIYVLQGNITIEEAMAAEEAAGINNATATAQKTNSKTFNLAGQAVNKNFKGIVIRNGQKLIQK